MDARVGQEARITRLIFSRVSAGGKLPIKNNQVMGDIYNRIYGRFSWLLKPTRDCKFYCS